MILREKTKNRIIKQLESIPFHDVKRKILHGELGYEFDSASHNFCLSWLLNKESIKQEERDSKRDAREISTLRIAKSAKKLTRRQLRYAIYSTIIALIAIIIGAQSKIIETINILINLFKNF